MLQKINFPAVFILVVYPLVLFPFGYSYISSNGIGAFEIILFLCGYYVSNITVGVGLHRLWSHDSYKTNKYVEFVLTLFAAGTLQGPTLAWASNHYKHHSFTDTEKDPHTPLKFKNKIKGFLWSHIGWMLVGEPSYKNVDKVAIAKLGKNKILRWQFRYYWQIATLMNTLVPAMVGFFFGNMDLASAYAGFLFIALGRALQQEITFCVNSACHFFGSKTYSKGTAGDVWWLAMFLLGENWHNYHHAFPSDYRNGARWYQADVHKWIIYIMSKLGLAWDLKRTDPVRVNAKISQTRALTGKVRQEELSAFLNRANELIESLHVKIKEVENSSSAIKDKLIKSYNDAQEKLGNLKSQLNRYLKENSIPSEKIIKLAAEKIKDAESSVKKLCSELEKATNSILT